VPSAGNWSRAKSADEARQPAAGAGTSTRKPAARSSSGTVPVPRAKPGSKAAKRDAACQEAGSQTASQQAEESSVQVPVPRAKPKQARKVEAGLPVQGGEAQRAGSWQP
jgi:hypothetical protein